MRAITTLCKLTTIEQLQCFLESSEICHYVVLDNKDERYQRVRKTLVQLRYLTLGKREKGVVICYLGRLSGYSRQQLTRLIRQLESLM